MLKTAIICFILIGTVTLTDVSYYEILGVTKQASTQQIRQAYKKLAIKLHPDKNTDETELEKFLKITEAYEILKDPGKRRKYDIYGSSPSYTRRYDYHSQAEYNNLYYNGLYHDDLNVHTLSGAEFSSFMSEGFYFINFYSPFCPPCQNLVDHWKKLANVYKGIVKVGAVNCKYHNSFCYNSMRIGSYPTLIFYPNGKDGRQIYYRGEHNFDSLEEFIMPYISSEIHLPTVTKILDEARPIVYVLGSNRIERNALLRIAYRLKGLVTVVAVVDDNLRQKLSKDDYTTLVYKHRDAFIEMQSTDEEDIVKEIVDSLPSVETIDPDELKDIRNKLRNDETNTWILHFSCEHQNKLLLHQMQMQFPDLNFGSVECSRWAHLCASLQVEGEECKGAGVWGALKRGGGYQRAVPTQRDARDFIQSALSSRTLHTLSVSDFNRILDSDSSIWVLYVVPHGASFDHQFHAFLEASKRLRDNDDISFGVIWCDARTQRTACGRVVHSGQPVLLVQRAGRQHTYGGRADVASVLQFVQLLSDTTKLELSEEEVLEIVAIPGRAQTWLVAFLPPNCGQLCDRLAHQWRIVANKLKPLSVVRVGVLQCEQLSGFCANVRSPTARLYPVASSHHFTVGLQQLSEAPYMLEWALELIGDSIHKLNWNSFSKSVIAEELNPTSGRKPWLVYFHSPRCYRCYEMFADFAIAGILLKRTVELGKVNCVSERGLCQHEQISSYPTLKLYLHRNKHTQFSSAVAIQVREYGQMLQEIQGYIAKYDQSLLDRINSVHGANIKHDEF